MLCSEPNSSAFNDEFVQEGKSYHYTFGTIEDVGGSVVKAESEITIPKDLEVKGRMELVEANGFNRVFFRNNSRLVTSVQDYILTTNEIFSDDGAVVAFDELRTAGATQSSRNSGSITIQSMGGAGTLP